MIAAAFEIMRHSSVTSAASPTTWPCRFESTAWAIVARESKKMGVLTTCRRVSSRERKRLRDGRRDNYYEYKGRASKNCGLEAIPRRRAVLKIKHAGPPLEGPAPHRTAGLEYFQSTPVGRNKNLRHRRTARRVFYRRTRCRHRPVLIYY